tara:strand:- start:38 stop:211 length:174 start_codon:yes stop_codon:yes gene_type:complete
MFCLKHATIANHLQETANALCLKQCWILCFKFEAFASRLNALVKILLPPFSAKVFGT